MEYDVAVESGDVDGCGVDRSHGVAAITLDSESNDPSSNLGGTSP